jgi:hypothetical protein
MSVFAKNSKQLPAAVPAVLEQKPRVSDQWAEAKAQVEALEDNLYKAQVYANEMVNRAKVAEAQLHDAKNEIIHLKNERDYFQTRFIEITEAVKIGSTIFFDAMRKAERKAEEEKPTAQAPQTPARDQAKIPAEDPA